MNEIPSPSQLAPVLLEVLRELGGRAHFKQIEEMTAAKLGLTSGAVERIRSGKRTEFAYRMSWARTKCKQDGLLIKEEKGFWSLPSPS